MEYGRFNTIIGIVVWYNPTPQEKEALLLYNKDLETVIVVDNSKEDNSSLCADIPNVLYLHNGNKNGIAGALNVGCREALRMGADWVLTMDQDSQWNQSSLPEYISEVSQYSAFDKVAIFSPYHDCDGTPEKHHRRGRYESRSGVMCSGNLLRLIAWQEAGGFREDFFIDMVDAEMCSHLIQLGWDIIRANEILLTHHLGDGVQYLGPTRHRYTPHPAWRYYYIGRNTLRLVQLYPEMASHYRGCARKEMKRLLLYDWTDKRNRLRFYVQGLREGRQPYPPKDVQLTLSPPFESLRLWLSDVFKSFETHGELIHDARNQIRVFEAPDGTQLVIKRFRRPWGFKRFIYSLFRTPKAERAYRNALLLAENHIPTPEAIGYARNDGWMLNNSYLITRQSTLKRDFYEFRYHDVIGSEDIIRAFARLIAEMHKKGIYHLDLSPGNILFDKDKDGSVRFEIVDINRLQKGCRISKRKACRNFCRLWGRMDLMDLLSREYALARGWDEEEVRRLVVHYWRRFWHIRNEEDIERIFDRSLKR